jgi:hypothetical protein
MKNGSNIPELTKELNITARKHCVGVDRHDDSRCDQNCFIDLDVA